MERLLKRTIAILALALAVLLNWAAMNHEFETAPSAVGVLSVGERPDPPLAARVKPRSSEMRRSLEAMIERPLFNPERAPAVAETTADKGDAQSSSAKSEPSFPKNLEIIGVMTRADGANLALIRLDRNLPAKWYGIGKDVDGWRVAEIERRRVILEAGSQKREVSLRLQREESPPEE